MEMCKNNLSLKNIYFEILKYKYILNQLSLNQNLNRVNVLICKSLFMYIN